MCHAAGLSQMFCTATPTCAHAVQVIMIVKGNMRQVSFLHVYHHVSISIIWCDAICISQGKANSNAAALPARMKFVPFALPT